MEDTQVCIAGMQKRGSHIDNNQKPLKRKIQK